MFSYKPLMKPGAIYMLTEACPLNNEEDVTNKFIFVKHLFLYNTTCFDP
jgi:hypothetical protein